MHQRQKKQNKLATILPEMATKLASVTERDPLNIDATLARIMNDVLVERESDNGSVTVRIENNGDTSIDLDITEIVETAAEPAVEDGAEAMEMDGEWFIKWSPSVSGGETAELAYETESGVESSAVINGIEDEKLTVVDQ